MTIDFPDFETVCDSAPERLSDQFALFSPEKFLTFFHRVRRLNPENAMRACILYLNERGLDEHSHQMISWLNANEYYFASLLDPKLLSLESAKRVSGYFRKTDPHFFARLSRFAFDEEGQRSPALKTRAIAILDELSQNDPIIPWLRQLTEHPDERVRSKAVKALCRLRPSKSTIELHLQSGDPRVRANAIEALWHVSDSDTMPFFETALNDSNHRVVTNAVIGLYYRKDPRAFDMLIQLTEHSSEMFRLAAVWALGTVGDQRAIPALQRLLGDPADAVRQRAQRVLATFGPEPDGAAQRKTEPSEKAHQLLESERVSYPQVA